MLAAAATLRPKIKMRNFLTVTRTSQQLRARVWILVGVELSERGLTLTLEREENGETIRREEWATDCEAA